MNIIARLTAWLDTHAAAQAFRDDDRQVDWLRCLPFVLLHLACLAAFWVGVSWQALAVAGGLYALRMFAITAVYHRLLAHRAYRAPRWLQFLGALVANASAQRGPLWWAAHHRQHHRESDREADVHSPVAHGFLRSHVLWFMTPACFRTRLEQVPDLAALPELRFLDRFDQFAPLALAAACYGLGEWLGTGGWQMVVWGFVISTVVLAHATFTVNSLAHTWGRRAYDTADDSRNNPFIALITFGEGWHNNHHRYPQSVRQGFRWWQYDPTWWALRGMMLLGLVRGLKPVPARVIAEGRH